MTGNNWQPKDPEVARLKDRLMAVEISIDNRLDDLDGRVREWQQRQAASRSERQTRTWQIILACVTGVVLPLVSIGILALIHLARKG